MAGVCGCGSKVEAENATTQNAGSCGACGAHAVFAKRERDEGNVEWPMDEDEAGAGSSLSTCKAHVRRP